jgi:threonine dehydratase
MEVQKKYKQARLEPETPKAGEKMMYPDLAARIEAAYDRIGSDILRTPLEFSPALSRLTGSKVYVKWEIEQRTGSFKFRGALNRIRSLTPAEKEKGVVSASTGNHGLGISRAAEMEGVGLTLVLPQNVASAKRNRLEKGGAEIIIHGASCEKAEVWGRELAARSGRKYISPYNDEEIIAGQGTIGREILEDLPDVEAALVPVGGGGLIAGIAGWLKRSGRTIEVYGVEPVNSAVVTASLTAGAIVEIVEEETIADAVAGGLEPGAITFPLCRELLDGMILVEETLIKRAMRLLWENHHRVVEGGGALGLAGLIKEPLRLAGKKVAVVASGGNIAPEVFEKAIR